MKVLVVSGFLGAGKTTFITEMARRSRRKFVVMENEMGAVGVDGGLLSDALGDGIEVWELTQGCICCSMKSDFATSVLTIESALQPEYLLVEPTGVGMLSRIMDNLSKIAYERIELLSPITLLDSLNCRSQAREFPELFVDQLASAGTVVFSKAENLPPEERAALEELARRHAPKAEIVSQPYGQQSADWWETLWRKALDGSLLKEEAPEAEFANSDDMHSYDDIPLPEEPPDVEIGATNPPEPPCVVEEVNVYEQAYEQAYNRLYGEKKDDGLLWGKPIKKGKVRPIDSIIEEENKVIVEGEFVKTLDKDSNLIAFNEREMRTKDISLSFNLCDGTGGLFIKMRFSAKDGNDAKAECKQLTSVLKPGMRLRIQGNVAPDRFNNDEMTLTPFGIMKIDVPERKDNAEVKRVELHCHTKMSKMDGLTPMKDLVKKAIKWGHKALAITDHGVVQAFPFCYDAAQGSDLKLIFGMEGYLISDRAEIKDELDQEAVETKKKTSRNKIKSNHIIILAKNETGLRNLYKLVSISHLRYLSGRPLLPRKVLEQHRDGLILGSACEAGELYRAMMAGASEEALEEIASKSHGGKFGARDIRNFIRKNIEDKVADIIVNDGATVSKITISANEKGIKVTSRK